MPCNYFCFVNNHKLYWYQIARLMVRYLIPLAFFDIDTKYYQNVIKFHNTFLNYLRVSRSEKHLLDLTLIELCIKKYLILKMCPLIMDKLNCFWLFFMFKCLNSVTTLLSFITFLLLALLDYSKVKNLLLISLGNTISLFLYLESFCLPL